MEDKAIRVIEFSGEQKDWRLFSRKFLAKGGIKGYRNLLLGATAIPPASEVIDETNDAGKAKAEAKKRNVSAMGDLMLSVTNEVLLSILENTISTEYPEGNCREVWKAFITKYEPRTGATKVSLKKEFTTSKLSNVTDDPDEWISELEVLQKRLATLQTTISEEDM